MKDYQHQFIKLLLEANALKFGEFELKSGRLAPYFLNAGAFFTGEWINALGQAYADALVDAGFEPNVVYGPAYKGIPLSVITTSQLQAQHGKNVGYTFNRKKLKNYGASKGNPFVGAPMDENTKVLLVDDVITAGTAIRETVDLLKENGNPEIIGVLIAMNRMEKTNEGGNALQDIEALTGAPVRAIVDLDDVIEALYNKEVNGQVYIDDEQMEKIRAYRAQYGIEA